MFICLALCVSVDLVTTVDTNSAEEPESVLLAADQDGIDICLGDVSGQQPLYLVVFGTYTKQIVNNLALPPVITNEKVKLHTIAMNIILIAMAGNIMFHDIRLALSTPWRCLQVVPTGTQQMITSMQVVLRWTDIPDDADKVQWYMWYGWAAVTLPYLPLIAGAVIFDVLPGCLIFLPVTLIIVLVLRVPMFAVYALYDLWFNLDAGDDLNGTLAVQCTMAPTTILIKFLGEATARFYNNQGWWSAVYRTWSERRIIYYVAEVRKSFSSVLNAINAFV